ncbi:MAG: hypothetical protein ABSC92_01420 [Rhizomicrobium sp.]
MNPEFRRNIWLELTPRRVLLMTIVLVLAFFAAALSGGVDYRPATVAEMFYYFIVVIWGSRNAALSVVGEIRDRTWDSQRLSSLTAAGMIWAKLFGSTIFNWYGGAICLAVIATSDFVHLGPFAAVLDLVYLLTLGAISQAAALLASLVAVRRRQSHSRFGLYIYQLVGIAAAIAVSYVWEAADPAGSFITHKPATQFILWWGQRLDARPFFLVTLALFTAWTLVGCYREMRVELKMRNGPLVWAAFLLFMGVYVAGFDAWLAPVTAGERWDAVALRLALAATTYGVLSYAMVLLEPKDRVLYRWLGGKLAKGRLGGFILGLQGWMMSYLATLVVVIALVVWLGRSGLPADQAVIAAFRAVPDTARPPRRLRGRGGVVRALCTGPRDPERARTGRRARVLLSEADKSRLDGSRGRGRGSGADGGSGAGPHRAGRKGCARACLKSPLKGGVPAPASIPNNSAGRWRPCRGWSLRDARRVPVSQA